MQVRVLYFGVLKDHMNSEGESLSIPEGSSLATLLHSLVERKPSSVAWKASAVALNLVYQRDRSNFEEVYLHDGDEIAFLPPVSGGACAD